MRALLCLLVAALAAESAKYVVVSAPRLNKVMYFKVPGNNVPEPLIDSGLKSPLGLAIDTNQMKLFVADPDLRKVLAYKIGFSNGNLIVMGDPVVAAHNVEARWVAVDGVGNLFFTDEVANQVMKVPATSLAAGDTAAAVVYNGAKLTEVNRPGGVAVDNFHVFWTNKAMGTQMGSVVKGVEEPDSPDSSVGITQIARNANKVYGVCLSQNNVFYTHSKKFLYGVKKNGGAIATVSDKLLEPRGCAWDGDGTVYVADKTANAIYSFPGNMHMLAPASLTKLADFDDAFGLAVVQGAAAGVLLALSALVAA